MEAYSEIYGGWLRTEGRQSFYSIIKCTKNVRLNNLQFKFSEGN